MFMPYFRFSTRLLLFLGLFGCAPQTRDTSRIPIKVVVVSMFEIGKTTGDRPGEFQFWAERLPLDQTLDFPQGVTPLHYNAAKGVLGVVTGIGTQYSTATIMGLGMDPRFDLRKTYWLVAGIAGGDPEDTSPADAVWADWAIDGDIGHEIDAREIPNDWPTGYIPFRNKAPYQKPYPDSDQEWGVRYQLNPELLQWAYNLTRDIELTTSEGSENLRNKFSDFAGAQHPPRVRIGAQLSASTYWHGALMNNGNSGFVVGERGFGPATALDTVDAPILKPSAFGRGWDLGACVNGGVEGRAGDAPLPPKWLITMGLRQKNRFNECKACGCEPASNHMSGFGFSATDSDSGRRAHGSHERARSARKGRKKHVSVLPRPNRSPWIVVEQNHNGIGKLMVPAFQIYANMNVINDL